MVSIIEKPLQTGCAAAILAVATLPVWSPAQTPAAPSQFANLPNTEQTPERFQSPAEAVEGLRLPPGFRATLFASEPMVRQVIAVATDAGGRLWAAENYTYSERKVGFHPDLRDRIVILEDHDGDGCADEQKIFWDQAEKLTSVAVGLGGVWALCPPKLLFLPDLDGDDKPDGPPQVMLEGWDDGQVRHNVANGLQWGPDGWLYGRHGILGTSRVGTPETPPEQRLRINCGIWRFHPESREFQVVASGTTNPWGSDWDRHGQMFFINTVIGHLWHVVPGAHYERMYGVDFNPHLYELIPQTADHFHWDVSEQWHDIRKLGVSSTTDLAGGGHAHSGLLIYQGDNWPADYRHDAYTLNFHGRRINRDLLQRQGAGYVARHADDLVHFSDPWFRGVDLITGPDGSVFVSDWSDAGECHDDDGVHRESGRIYKISYGSPDRAVPQALSEMSQAELVALLNHDNAWFARQSQIVLHGLAIRGHDLSETHAALRRILADSHNEVHRLRALWTLAVTNGTDDRLLSDLVVDRHEHLRVWAIRLLADKGTLMEETSASNVLQAAKADKSGLVLLFLASGLQQLEHAQRWPLAQRLAERAEFTNDPAFPRMLWYGIEPAVATAPERAVELFDATRIGFVRRSVVRRLGANLKTAPDALAALTPVLAPASDQRRQRDLLDGMLAAMEGRRRATPPAGWLDALDKLAHSEDVATRQRAQELLVVFGDGRAVDELKQLAVDAEASIEQRRRAIRSLVVSRADGVPELLQQLLDDRDVALEAIRGLAAYANPATPEKIVARYQRFRSEARREAITALASRPSAAHVLLAAVAAGRIPDEDVPAYQIRQMWSLNDEAIRTRLQELWPKLRHTSQEKAKKIEEFRSLLSDQRLQSADPSAGRVVFQRACAMCHRLYGSGQNVGPDLTGSQRNNLSYLLHNILDPSLQLAENYRMSIIRLVDGRTLNGVIVAREGGVVKIQMPTELLTIPADDIERTADSTLSMMPERLLDSLSQQQTCDLFAYLMSPQQVPLPESQRAGRPTTPAEGPNAP